MDVALVLSHAVFSGIEFRMAQQKEVLPLVCMSTVLPLKHPLSNPELRTQADALEARLLLQLALRRCASVLTRTYASPGRHP